MAGYRLSSRSLHVHHLPIDHHEHAFYARSGIVVCCQRGVQSETRPHLLSKTRSAEVFSETQRHEKRAGAIRPRLFDSGTC
jgi:hypothetical protein